MNRIASLLLSIGLMALTTTARAQVTVVVRPSVGASLTAPMNNVANKQQAPDSLFGNVIDLRRLVDLPFSPDDVRNSIIATYPDSAAAREALTRLRASTGVAEATYSVRYSVDGFSDDPFADSTGHIEIVDAHLAWKITTGTPDVHVGLVDTGIFFDHPDFAGQFWINPGEDLNGNGVFDLEDVDGVDNDGNGWVDDIRGYDFVDRQEVLENGDFRERDFDAVDDGSGHGTSVAGVIGAVQNNQTGISGIAPGVRLVPLRAFASDGIGSDVDIATAIVYAADAGLDVINLSFGDVYESSLMRDAIRYVVSKGTIVVASAGNNGGDAPHYPSDYPGVISVVWLNEDGTGTASRATHGVGIDIGAPGSFVFTTLQPFDTEMADSTLYGRRSGSSMAAPMVTAAAALLRSLQPDLTPTAIRDILTASASDINTTGWDHQTASGRLNIRNALINALPGRIVITSPENNAGFSDNAVSIIGSVLNPDLRSWSVQIAMGDDDLQDLDWSVIAASTGQVFEDTLVTLDAQALADGLYSLRLVATLGDGRDIEDRRRFYLDRTPPTITLRLATAALVDARHGLAFDIETDDLTTVSIAAARAVPVGNEPTAAYDIADSSHPTPNVSSDRLARRHGLSWQDQSLQGGLIHVSIDVRNTSGLHTARDTLIYLPSANPNSALMEGETLSVKSGFMLQQVTDFDNDGLREIVLNQFSGGSLGDTLVVAEYDGSGFRPVFQLVANVFPRDLGDTDGDGLTELLSQVGPASIILEQSNGASFPDTPVLVDTSSISNPSGENAIWSAGFFDTDNDGADEIVSHNTRDIRVFSLANGNLQLVQQLVNPTGVENSELVENTFEQPSILKGDFDDDGLDNFILGDGDGDWIMLEETGSGSIEIIWTYETDRYAGSSRYGSGDFDGDGVAEFVTYARNWLPATGDGEREPDIGVYYFWQSTGDNSFALEYTLAVPGIIDSHGSMTSLDADGDGKDELILIDSPFLYVLDRLDDGSWSLIFRQGPGSGEAASGPRSPTAVSGSLDGSAQIHVVFADADGFMRLLTPVAGASQTPPPAWIMAIPGGPNTAILEWRSVGSDSVVVYRSLEGGPFDPIASTSQDSLVDSVSVSAEYRLQAWFDGFASPLGDGASVFPHDPGIASQISYPSAGVVKIIYTNRVDPATDASDFHLTGDRAPDRLLVTDGGFGVRLTFVNLAAGPDTLFTPGLSDHLGLGLQPSKIPLEFPEAAGEPVYVTHWEIELPDKVVLTFNKSVDPASLTASDVFTLHPGGSVPDFELIEPDVLDLTIDGLNLAASGLNPTLELSGILAADGSALAAEGNIIKLFAAPTDLDEVLVYPNPVDTRLHPEEISIAGLPAGTAVRILSIDGVNVNVLPTTENAGEVDWDLRNKFGALVQSGVYLLHITSNDGVETIKKIVVVR